MMNSSDRLKKFLKNATVTFNIFEWITDNLPLNIINKIFDSDENYVIWWKKIRGDQYPIFIFLVKNICGF